MLSLTAHAKAACDGTDKLGGVLTSAAAVARMPSDTPVQVRERERVLGNTSALLSKAQHDIDLCAKLGTLTATDPGGIIESQQAVWETEELLGVLTAPDFFSVSSYMNDSACKQYARALGSYVLSSVSSSNRMRASSADGIILGENQLIVAFARRGAVDNRLLNSTDANDALRANLELQGTDVSPNCVSAINSFITSLDWAHFGGL